MLSGLFKRKLAAGWDLNPRDACAPNGFKTVRVPDSQASTSPSASPAKMGFVTATERREQVARLYPQLRSIPKVAAAIGCSNTTVWESLKRLEISRMSTSESLALADAEIRRRVTQRRKQVLRLDAELGSTYKVASVLGVPRGTVCNDLAAIGKAPGQRTKQKGRVLTCPNCRRQCWRYYSQMNASS